MRRTRMHWVCEWVMRACPLLPSPPHPPRPPSNGHLPLPPLRKWDKLHEDRGGNRQQWVRKHPIGREAPWPLSVGMNRSLCYCLAGPYAECDLSWDTQDMGWYVG